MAPDSQFKSCNQTLSIESNASFPEPGMISSGHRERED
jgi:hypothetical protein